MQVKNIIAFIFILSIFLFAQIIEAQNLSSAKYISLIKGKSYLLTLRPQIKIKRYALSNQEIVDVQEITCHELLLIGRKIGTTRLIVWPEEGNTQVYDISVNLDIDEIKRNLEKIVPEANVDIKPARNGIVVTGEVEDIEMMERVLGTVEQYVGKKNIVNLLKVKGPQQVQLKVRIAEVSRTGLARRGINLFYSGSNKFVLGIFSPESTYMPTEAINTGTLKKGEGIIMGAPFREGFQVLFKNLKTDFTTILSLLQREGLAKILAEPTLVCMSGQEASFLVGGEVPIPVPYMEQTVTITFRPFGIRLRFTPTVIGKETISMKVAPEVSEIDPSLQLAYAGFVVPGFTTRRAETTIQLKDGQTFAIAGLLKDSMRSSIDKFPILGNIPILGALFRSVEFKREETELLIIVTPHLAKPMEAKEVPPPPGQEIYPPSDFELFLLGKMAHWRKVSIPKGGGPAGDFGFMR